MAQIVACDIHPINNLRILQYLENDLGLDDDARAAWARRWIDEGFSAMETMLDNDSRTGTHCFGNQPTLADICLVPQVFNSRRFGVDLARYPTLGPDLRELHATARLRGPGPRTATRRRMTLAPNRLAAFAACAAGVALAAAPTPAGLPAGVLPAAAVAVVCIGLWATAVIPEYLTAVIFCFLAVTVAGAPPDVVFAGFQSTAAWLVFGGLIVAASVQTTGLGARIATAAVAYFGRSYRGFLWRIVLTAALMGFIMPSNMGRVLVMLPIFLNMGERLGFGPGSKRPYRRHPGRGGRQHLPELRHPDGGRAQCRAPGSGREHPRNRDHLRRIFSCCISRSSASSISWRFPF